MAYGNLKADNLIFADSSNNNVDTVVPLESVAGKAPLASPAFTGTPTAPTAAADTNSTQIATTAYVDQANFASTSGDTFTGDVTVGADTDGHDVKFFGASAGKYFLWDESADKVVIEGAVDLNGQTNHLAGSEHILMPAGGLLFQHNPGSGAENVLLMRTDYCKLYADSDIKFETNSAGAKVTGSLEVTSSFQGTYASSSVGEKFKIQRVTMSGNPDTVDGRQYTTYYTTMQVDDAEDLFVELHENTIFEIKWDNPNAYANDSMSTTDHGRLASFKPQEGVKLFYNDVKKLETTSTGVDVTGELTSTTTFQPFVAATTTVTAAVNTKYTTDTSSSAFTLTLPASPTVGQYVTVTDIKGTWATNNLTVAQNGNNIQGAAADLVCNVNHAHVTLIYTADATTGWVVT